MAWVEGGMILGRLLTVGMLFNPYITYKILTLLLLKLFISEQDLKLHISDKKVAVT